MVNEKFATEPVPPEFPHAPQVNQLGESSTLLKTVVFDGMPEGVGEGDGAGLGAGDALAMGAPALVEEGFPPQPVKANNATSPNHTKIPLRTVTPPEFGLQPCTHCTKRAKNADYYEYPNLRLPLGRSEMRQFAAHNGPEVHAQEGRVVRMGSGW